MGIINETEEDDFQNDNSDMLQSFSTPYSPSFYLNNKIYDKNQTIQSVIGELLNEKNDDKNEKDEQVDKDDKEIEKLDNDSIHNIDNTSFNSNKTNKTNNIISNKDNKIYQQSKFIFQDNKENENENEKDNNKSIENENDEDNTKNIHLEYKSSSLQKDIRFFYTFKDYLGEGHFASVRTAYKKREYPPHKLFAVKSISLKKLTENEREDLIHEVEIISHLEHPHIIKFYETYHDQFYFHIVTELCRGNNLNIRLKKVRGRMKEEHVRIIIMKILHAMNYCHSFGVVHRDLKPENNRFWSINFKK